MAKLCTSVPIPSFNGLYESFVANLTIPPKNFKLPSLPTLPSPLFPTMSMPNFEIEKMIASLQGFQLVTTCMAIIQPLVNFLSLDIGSILPKFPVLDFNLIDLVEGKIAPIIAKIKSMIAKGESIPGIPDPFFPDAAMPEIQVVQTLSNVVASYLLQIPSFITGLIGQVTSILEIGNISGIPEMPTMDTIVGKLKERASEISGGVVASIQDIMKIDVTTLFDFSMPGFPKMPAIPSPLIPSFTIPTIEFHEALAILINYFASSGLLLILDFVQSVLSSFMTFEFPTICIDFEEA